MHKIKVEKNKKSRHFLTGIVGNYFFEKICYNKKENFCNKNLFNVSNS